MYQKVIHMAVIHHIIFSIFKKFQKVSNIPQRRGMLDIVGKAETLEKLTSDLIIFGIIIGF